MCAVDIQCVNAFVNRLFRKEIKDKHKIAIEKLERHCCCLPTPSFVFNATL